MVFFSGNTKINNICRSAIYLSCIRGANDISNNRKGNPIPKLVIKCNILRNYLAILSPLPANIGVHVTKSSITAPIIVKNGSNDSSVSGYDHITYKIITSLPICGGEFLYLLPCSIVLSYEHIYIYTVKDHVIITGGTNNSCVPRYIHIPYKVIITLSTSGDDIGFLLPYPIHPTKFVGRPTTINILIARMTLNYVPVTR